MKKLHINIPDDPLTRLKPPEAIYTVSGINSFNVATEVFGDSIGLFKS